MKPAGHSFNLPLLSLPIVAVMTAKFFAELSD